MGTFRKALALLVVCALALGALALGGCAKKESTDTGGQTGARVIKSVDDLKEGDKVGVQSGTTGEAWAKKNLEPKGVQVVPYDDILLAFQALQAGDVVGVINDLPISQDIVKDEARGLEIVQEIQTDETYGFAFNKNNPTLRDAVNWALAEVIKDGTYNEIYTKWFGSEPMSMPEATSGVTEKPAGEIKTLTPGKIIVGSDTAFPPFENVENGEVVGFDVDLMKAIGEKLGMTVEFKSYKFDALITGLQAGTEFDMVASAMTITDERKQSVDFSDPYINSNQSLAVRKAQ
ncbi:MAG: transporter substrate-binding domain-containing protein [Anaerosomatales bacterium]|nr:transporter substrate-binding domain-containing protein [Anaerosomatales bacterium]MDI6843796.1 transporter substrate-binding domain-containing protein [Anaerosomatales bacterium]GAV30945.1 ABC-type amino acid transport/signal transduction systems, periplasmic component/domain [Coriobacteriaceae bacterium EMTCatB1]